MNAVTVTARLQRATGSATHRKPVCFPTGPNPVPDMRYNPRQIAFERCGTGRAAILIHGNPATRSLWRPIVQTVSDLRTIYAIDLPGFGESPMPEDEGDFAMERLAQIVLGFADAHRLDFFDLVGHSFGGGISLTIGAMAPERVRTLAAITPLTEQVPFLGRLIRSRPISAIARAAWGSLAPEARRWGARKWARISYGKGFSAERASQIAREADRPDLFVPLSALMRLIDPGAYARRLDFLAAATGIPLLLVGAGADRIIPHEQFLRLASRFPHARVVDMADCGHVPMWQYPDRIAELLREMWRAL